MIELPDRYKIPIDGQRFGIRGTRMDGSACRCVVCDKYIRRNRELFHERAVLDDEDNVKYYKYDLYCNECWVIV